VTGAMTWPLFYVVLICLGPALIAAGIVARFSPVVPRGWRVVLGPGVIALGVVLLLLAWG
jgi:hypothetical protein